MGKTRKLRKGPSNSASEGMEGTIKEGGNKELWVIKKIASSQRWVPYHSCELNGFKPLSVDFLKTHVGKPVQVYERQMSYVWPNSLKDFDVKYTFTPTGNGILKEKVIDNWLKKQSPKVKSNDLFIIEGKMVSKDIESILQAAPNGLVSSNLMNTQAFVKV